MSEVIATVLLATYNGAKTLPAMLEGLCRQSLWRSHWKLVVVDNNSNDATRAILESYRDRLPLVIDFEPRQGKEHALATGFRHLGGDLLVLTDDDVIPARDWLEQLVALAGAQPAYDIFGGLIQPAWEQQPDPWIERWADTAVLYALNGDLAEGPVSANLIFGPNSAFRRRIVPAAYAVHQDLGPNAALARYAMGQDTMFALNLERQGARAFHSRRPSVRHVIPARYVEEDWILSRAERFGMGMVQLKPELFTRKRMLGGLPTGAALKWAAMEPVVRVLRPLPRSEMRFRLLWKHAMRQGILRAFARQRALRRQPNLAAVELEASR